MDPSKDWLLRTILNLGQSLAGGRQGTRVEIPEPDNALGDDDLLPEILKEMIRGGKLDEAENLLFRFIENYPLVENYSIGLDFYARLAELSDDELARDGWSRREIKEGVVDLHRLIFHEDPPFDPDESEGTN